MRPADTAMRHAGASEDGARTEGLLALSQRAGRSVGRLSDGELLQLLREHRWAVGRLASAALSRPERARLNAAVLVTHGLLHAPRDLRERWQLGLRRLGGPLALSLAVFVGGGVLAFLLVLNDPLLAYSLAPRSLIAQIDAGGWGQRGSSWDDLGMMFFYWGNNLRAILTALALGVLGGVTSMVPVFANGVILGAVFGATVHEGATQSLLAWIGPHAVPELGGLVLAGAIGLELGSAWLRPGSLARAAALRKAGAELAPYVGVTALLVIAAAPLEGFVAPLPLPLWADGCIVLAWLVGLGAGAVAVLRAKPASS